METTLDAGPIRCPDGYETTQNGTSLGWASFAPQHDPITDAWGLMCGIAIGMPGQE